MPYRIALIFSLALLFVWSLPGVTALRYLLLLGGLGCLLPELARLPWRNWRSLIAPLAALGLLTAWLLYQAVFIAPEPAWVRGELAGQWLPGLLALGLGLLLGRASVRREVQDPEPWGAAWLPLGIVLVLASQALITIVHAVVYWFQTGALLVQVVPLTGGKLEMSFILNILLAFLAVDLFGRASRRGPLLPVPLAVTLALLVVALISLFLAGARNGLIGLLFLVTSATYLFLYDQRQRLGLLRAGGIALGITALVAIFAFSSIKADPRWRHLGETARLAWDIDGHDAWQGGRPMPLLADGSPADASAYLRISWLRVGARLISENPLGVGYGRNAFAHALRPHYPVQLGHAHSGFVDLGVGGGAPAIILWLAFVASLVWLGWRSFFSRRHRLTGLLLIFLASGFSGRMVLDSVNRDHMLQIFFFLSGVLLVLANRPERPDGS